MKPSKSSAFTLIELIIVITILAILATIAFISYEGYTTSARDSQRLSNIKNIETGLSLMTAKSGSYPMPDSKVSGGTVLTGSIAGTTYAYLGVIGKTVSQVISVNPPPLDPVSQDSYLYGVSADRKYFQIATVLEGTQAFQEPSLVPTTYAATTSFTLKAKVLGDYPGYMKFTVVTATGTDTYIANVPSLLWNNSGSIILFSTGGTYTDATHPNTPSFIINKEANLPYTVGAEPLGDKGYAEIVQSLAGTGAATLTGVNITAVATATTSDAKQSALQTLFGTGATPASASLLASFGGNLSAVTTAVLGNTTTGGSTSSTPTPPPTPNSCATNPSFANLGALTTGTPTSVGQAWTYNTSGTGPCTYACINGYTGNNCSVAPIPAYVATNSTTTYTPTTTSKFTYAGVTVTVTGTGVGTSSAKYPGLDGISGNADDCDTPDIVLWTSGYNPQIWAACNVGATTSVGYDTVPAQPANPTTDGLVPSNRVANVQWNYYQWGRNDDITSGTWAEANVIFAGTLSSPANTTGNNTFYGGDATYGDWKWGGTSNPTGGWNTANTGNNQGPCASNYHIPTGGTWTPTTDWGMAGYIMSSKLGTPYSTNSDDDDESVLLRTTLKLPFSGHRYWDDGQYYYQGSNGYYWSCPRRPLRTPTMRISILAVVLLLMTMIGRTALAFVASRTRGDWRKGDMWVILPYSSLCLFVPLNSFLLKNMAMYDNLPVYKASYDFFVSVFIFTKTFPKEYKYTLGESIKNETIAMIMGIYHANSNLANRHELLQNTRTHLETIRLLLRLTHDLKQINLKKFVELNTEVESISKQLAMWQKSAVSLKQ